MDARPLSYLCSPGLLHSYCWGEQCAVYHAESGDTHVLNKVDVDILLSINENRQSAKDLSLEFEAAFEGGTDKYIETLLSNLAELSLIQIVNTEPAN